jgi:hypothetical protein
MSTTIYKYTNQRISLQNSIYYLFLYLIESQDMVNYSIQNALIIINKF